MSLSHVDCLYFSTFCGVLVSPQGVVLVEFLLLICQRVCGCRTNALFDRRKSTAAVVEAATFWFENCAENGTSPHQVSGS